MPVLAAIDIGSNAMRLKIAECPDPKHIHTLAHERLEVRLGSAAFAGKSAIGSETLARTISAIRHFKELIDAHRVTALRAVATSALREATNRDEVILAVREETGVELEIISGPEEARLIQLGAQLNNPLDGERAWFIDIGGGSAEVSVGDGKDLLGLASMRLGAVRLTKMFVESDPIVRPDLRRLIRFVHKELDQYRGILADKGEGAKLAIGTGGCASALVDACYSGNARGESVLASNEVNRSQIHKLTAEIVKMSAEERAELSGISASRSEIIVAGAVVMREVMDEFGIETLRISERGLRDGILVDLMERGAGAKRPSGRISDRRAGYVRHVAKKFGVKLPSAYHCAALASSIFDQLRDLHGFDESWRDRLEAAAILRETGKSISFSSFHKHSQYIISQAELLGFTIAEIHDIALVARYHRKAEPQMRHPEYAALSATRKERLRWLAGMLRIADGLDRRRQKRVQSVKIDTSEDVIGIEIEANGDVTLEKWSAEKNASLLSKVLRRDFVFTIA